MQGNPGITSSSESPESEYVLDNMLRRKVDPYSGQRTNSFLWQTDFLLGREMGSEVLCKWHKLFQQVVLSCQPYHMKHLAVLNLCLKN